MAAPTLHRGAGRARRSPAELLAHALIALHALAVLAVVEVAVRWVSLAALARRLGVRLDLAPPAPGAEPLHGTELPPGSQRRLRWARRVTDAWPISRGPCLRRALVAGHLLRRHRPTLRLGLRGTGDDLEAHAWLEIGGRPLEDVATFRVLHQRGVPTA